jgi:hypothetical protein
MTVQVDEDTKRIQELLSKGEYQAIFDQYAPVLQDMLFVQSLEEWLDFIRQEGALEEEPLKLYLSAWRGECLLLGCYEGEATQKVLDYLKGRIPDELLERLNGLAPVVIDIDELNGTLEKQIAPYREILDPIGWILHIGFEDVYCAGAYFLSVGVR